MAVLLLAAAACGDAGAPAGERREERGDTLVVVAPAVGTWGAETRLERVAAVGSADGNDSLTFGSLTALDVDARGRVYALDAQLPAVRVFDDALRPVAILSRSGGGPGELRSPDAGMAVLSDGRVVVRDPGNARIQLLTADGADAGAWPVPSVGFIDRQPFARQGDTLLTRIVVDPTAPLETWTFALARYAPDGRVLDTVPFPAARLTVPRLLARNGGNQSEQSLPFAPTSVAVWHPRGGFATADGDRYAVTWPSPDGFVRVERDIDAVAVDGDERRDARDLVTRRLRWLDPTWSWDGPEVPTVKPLLDALHVARDGRVWVGRELAGAPCEAPADGAPRDSLAPTWCAPRAWDVFAADGTFLGSVPVPQRMRTRPVPVIVGDTIIAVEDDADDVPQIVRYVVRRTR